MLNMITKTTILVGMQILALVAIVRASEMTVSLSSKVTESDLVAIIKIQAVAKGEIYVPDDWHAAAQDCKMDAIVLEQIKGDSPDTIVITAYSTSYAITNGDGSSRGMRFSTAGFSAYGIEPGKSYLAYLRKNSEGQYELSWNSKQYLEEISANGLTVNDIGQTSNQVSLRPKIWKLRALAFGTHPATLLSALIALPLLSIWIIRKRRKKHHKQSTEKQTEQVAAPPS